MQLVFPQVPAEKPGGASGLRGFSQEHSRIERDWESKFKAGISRDILRDSMQRLTARPHHVGSPYDKDNAEWILARFKEWGFDAKIETFQVLFPTPKERVVELVAPTRFRAKLQEPVIPQDPTTKHARTRTTAGDGAGQDDQLAASLDNDAGVCRRDRAAGVRELWES